MLSEERIKQSKKLEVCQLLLNIIPIIIKDFLKQFTPDRWMLNTVSNKGISEIVHETAQKWPPISCSSQIC